jgi:hypothetical protein
MQLQSIIVSENERHVSKDADVALWLDYREYTHQPKLQIAFDFAIMSLEQMSEFDAFKRSECESAYSYVEKIELLELFIQERPAAVSTVVTVTKFGHTYLRLHWSEMDQLVEWVEAKREQLNMNGEITSDLPTFTTDQSAVDTNPPTTSKRKMSVSQSSDKPPPRKRRREDQVWLKPLNLNMRDKLVLEENGMLTDKHMYAAIKLLTRQFPELEGLQSTLLPQNCGFQSISLGAGKG